MLYVCNEVIDPHFNFFEYLHTVAPMLHMFNSSKQLRSTYFSADLKYVAVSRE